MLDKTCRADSSISVACWEYKRFKLPVKKITGKMINLIRFFIFSSPGNIIKFYCFFQDRKFNNFIRALALLNLNKNLQINDLKATISFVYCEPITYFCNMSKSAANRIA
jgi:hypothetical protein